MDSKNSLIWVLTDDRPGNNSQVMGLAEKLGRPFLIKKITYTCFAQLPNFLKIGLLGISKNSKNSLLNQEQKPQIIISAGRKTAPVALFLKKYYQNIFAIHLMNPVHNLNKFDLVILPEHDKISGTNVIISIGALNRVDDKILKTTYKKFADELDPIKSPKIALLIGGSSKKGNFDIDVAEELILICSNIAKNMSANLLVTTSRRTPKAVIARLKDGLKKYSGFFFEWCENQANPYYALLEAADYLIVTGDSMSMCSESCGTGKPTYIFNPNKICPAKHLRLHQNLFENNYAIRLDVKILELKNYGTKKLDETSRIAAIIDDRLRIRAAKQTDS